MTHTNYSNTRSVLIVGSIAALGILALANPAAAWHNTQNNDTTVTNHNETAVLNTVEVRSNTGGNVVAGGDTRGGGEGGDARANHRANGGEGGDSGDANQSGNIRTGDATSIGTIQNDVNRNTTVVESDCGCEDRRGGDVEVHNANYSVVANGMSASSNTGGNIAAGGTTGYGGNGGDANAQSWSYWYHHMNNGVANGGDAGDSGDAENEGSITTGNAVSDALVINVVDRNVTRVNR